jgi:uncharacterized protein YejL (UPF0352 family)
MHDLFGLYLQGGRIDVGFLGGAQIDRFGNLNTTVIGDYAAPKTRLPGSGGACEIAINAKEILVIMRQSTRSFVKELDFRTSPGNLGGAVAAAKTRAAQGWGGSGPSGVITDLGVYGFDDDGEMALRSLHPGATLDDLDDDVGSDPVVLDLLNTIVGADPERFPTGLLSLQGGGIQLATVGEPHAELSEEQSRMAREVLARTPLLRRRFVSDDAHVAAIVLVIERTLSDEQEQALLGEMRRVLSHHRFDGSRLSITGLGAMRAEMVRSLREDQWRLVFFAVLGSLIVLMIAAIGLINLLVGSRRLGRRQAAAPIGGRAS